MKKIIVTGGAGYIGSHTVVELFNSGFTPIIIDNLCNSSIKNINGISQIIKRDIKWYNVNCCSDIHIEEIFKKEGEIEGVIHFSAFKSVEESIIEPNKYYENNIGSLEVILTSMKKNNVKNIIFSSSCTVYGKADILPVTEDAPFKEAESPYAKTKQICEKIILNDSSNSISLRYFNPIGCHYTSLIGDYSNNKATNLVPIITETAIGKRKKITIFGDDYNTPDGTCIRDYIHVVDLAKSHVKSIDFLINNKGKHVFNVGTGKGTSVKEIISSFEKINNIKINYTIGPRRKGDIEKIWSDNTLIKNQLNWEAKESLEAAIKSAWKLEQVKEKNV